MHVQNKRLPNGPKLLKFSYEIPTSGQVGANYDYDYDYSAQLN